MCTVTGLVHQPFATAAAAAAIALEPGARVSPRRPLPPRDRQVVSAGDAHELDVRPPGKARMALEPRTEPTDVSRVMAHDGVWIADRHRSEVDAVDRLRLADLDAADLERDVVAVDARRHVALADR